MMGSNINNKYKTTMCKHFEQTGFCPIGQKCHFAHGKAELRHISDPIPLNPTMVKQVQSTPKPQQTVSSNNLPPTISNYKTMKCKYFEKGLCKYSNNCGFAHGNHELRSPNSPLPQNVLGAISAGTINGATVTTTTGSPSFNDSNVQNQIAQQQIFYLISQMEGYHVKNPEMLAKIKQAQELNNTGNVQSAASVIYDVINRSDKSKEESDNYAVFVQNIQGLVPKIFQQMQQQYSQQASSLGLFGFPSQQNPSPTQPVNPTPIINFPGPSTSNSQVNSQTITFPNQYNNPIPQNMHTSQTIHPSMTTSQVMYTSQKLHSSQIPSNMHVSQSLHSNQNMHTSQKLHTSTNMHSSQKLHPSQPLHGPDNSDAMMGLTNMMNNFQPMGNGGNYHPN
jgi:hypothetical protein